MRPINHKGDDIYCLASLPVTVPLYGPESVVFVKTEKPCLLTMQMCLNADSWELLNVEELMAKHNRRWKQSCGSSASQS